MNLFLFIIAAVLALHGLDGWGLFLFAGVLVT
jgi:hypothetical protein